MVVAGTGGFFASLCSYLRARRALVRLPLFFPSFPLLREKELASLAGIFSDFSSFFPPFPSPQIIEEVAREHEAGMRDAPSSAAPHRGKTSARRPPPPSFLPSQRLT